MSNYATITLQAPCGYCASGPGQNHDACPVGIVSGDRKKLWICPCGCQPSGSIRCHVCGSRDTSRVDAATWECARHSEPQVDPEGIAPTPAVAGSPARKANKTSSTSTRPTSGECLCCGATTKGGLFLPGHDSRYLSATIKAIEDGTTTHAQFVELAQSKGVSDALLAKLNKRIEAKS